MTAGRSGCLSSTPVRPVDSSSAKSIDNIELNTNVNDVRAMEASMKGVLNGSIDGWEKCGSEGIYSFFLNCIKIHFLLITS